MEELLHHLHVNDTSSLIWKKYIFLNFVNIFIIGNIIITTEEVFFLPPLVTTAKFTGTKHTCLRLLTENITNQCSRYHIYIRNYFICRSQIVYQPLKTGTFPLASRLTRQLTESNVLLTEISFFWAQCFIYHSESFFFVHLFQYRFASVVGKNSES